MCLRHSSTVALHPPHGTSHLPTCKAPDFVGGLTRDQEPGLRQLEEDGQGKDGVVTGAWEPGVTDEPQSLTDLVETAL